MNFLDKLQAAQGRNNSLLCVGLDPDRGKIPKNQSFFEFNKTIINQTADLVCAYKPNIAFYASEGTRGLEHLKKTIDYIKKNYPQIPIVLDAKRGDIAYTSQMYAKELFDVYNADAITVNPYCGFDSLEPFFERRDRGIFVICRTSNPGAKDFQDLKVGKDPLYKKVAQKIVVWSKKYPNVMLEIGATWPEEIGFLRQLAPKMTFLIAGVGTQGGDLKGTLKNGLIKGSRGLILNSSRAIIYAQDPRKATQGVRDEINKYR